MRYFACFDLIYTWRAVYVILYSCGAYVIIILVKGLIMVNYIIKGLICNFWNYGGVKCKSDMSGLCDFYMSVIMCLVSCVTLNLLNLHF